MITSADEFIRLRHSADPADYRRAAGESAPLEVWLDVIERYPESRVWVAHNKTVPIKALAVLAEDPSSRVRLAVAMKRKLTSELLVRLGGAAPEHSREHLGRACPRRLGNVAIVALERLGRTP
ncbi:hypothetical protein Q5425_34555 [Amycolatopsis sp. A133]|uniref:hypothetical protein n=1 Tax=Amycolatopsis sp. A133 TaxID=3064472 RepID=UPI0027FC4B98|nr:hypothetical protein [Amycolatopsis sp. A133]MDQ7808887.1 hypothetical protein [Amycolatopsis sp. A133]